MHQFEVVIHQFCVPARHSSVVISGILPEQQIGVVGVNFDLVRCLMEIVLPVPEHFSQS
jgi:hypothetical protein